MSTAVQTPLKLHRLEISNFMRVDALTIDADGNHVVISGANGLGKTSAVEAIWVALKGHSIRELPEPIRRGADRASVTLDLGDYQVTRHWTEKSSRLVVTAEDGSKVGKPQDLLNGFLGAFSLDPIAFLERRPSDQVDDVLAIAGVEPPTQAVEEITGQRLPPKPKESADQYLMRLSADETGLFYVQRREAHRQVEQKRAALEEHRRLIDRLGGPLKPSEQPQSASELLAKIEALQEDAEVRRGVQASAADDRRDHRESVEKLSALKRERSLRWSRVEQLENEVARLQAEASAERQRCDELAARIEKGDAVVAELDKAATVLELHAKSLFDPAPQITDLRRQVATVEQNNAQRSKRALACEHLERLSSEAEQAAAEHRRLDEVLDGIRGLRAHLLDGVDLGVDGLEVGQGELRLNGVSFRQSSMAERIRVAAAVAMKQQPRLRLLRLDECERLDAGSKELLLRLADENDYQCIMTCVKDTDSLRVEIVGAE